ncbi:Thioredoxin-like fold [Pseudocohnilembus persalinus]|uniref:Thioredoxin-like fold n=1 Tax=Pseudocohnilembus persalinus TaxID=266149 RepID=A0A0V0QGS3_PSEPJ|nr:Thioredoxin-like fold [Pseudocohnilembus persalinus]|eukprot:KRX01336.1 Thioredoxin-like fold [Pseudocohnilembus persalinus]
MQNSPRQKLEKIIFTIFITLLLLDGIKILNAPPAPVADQENQQQQENLENTQFQNQEHSDHHHHGQNHHHGHHEHNKYDDFQDAQEINDEQNIQKQKIFQNGHKQHGSYLNPNTLHIQLCTASPYKSQEKFNELKQALEDEIQFIDISTSEYPVPEWKAIIGKLCSYSFYAVLLFSLFGDKIFGQLGMAYPGWYILFKEKKMVFSMGAVFLSNFLSGYILQTGAFEMIVNDDLIYSNLGKNGVPDIYTIVNLVSKAVAK